GNQIQPILGAGSIYPTMIDWPKTQPKVTIPHQDLTVVNDNGGSADVPQEGKLISGWRLPMIRRDPNGSLVALAKASHGYLSLYGRVTPTRIANGSGANPLDGELSIGCTEVPGHAPIEVATSVALA